MREFAADAATTVHPQTVIEHFGSWNAAKRQAGPRAAALRDARGAARPAPRAGGGARAGTPTARDLDERRGAMPSKSLSGTRSARSPQALREAGFDVPVGEERLERAVEQGAGSRASSAGCRSSRTGRRRGSADAALLTEWQVYRLIDGSPALGRRSSTSSASACSRRARRRARTGRVWLNS